MKKNLLFTAFALITSMQTIAQSLVSISPNTANQGQQLLTTITGSGTYFQSSSPQGNIQDSYLQYGIGNNIYGDFLSIFIVDDTHFDITYTIPAGAIIGVYDLHVDYIDTTVFPPVTVPLVLPQAFTIGNPDGFITGTVYNDINQNGVKDIAEPGVAGQQVQLLPTNITLVTDANGNYSFAVVNGSYTVQFVNNASDFTLLLTASPLAMTINNNNSGGNDFGVMHGLLSVAPNTVLQNQTIQLTVVANSIFQTNANPYGNILSAALIKSVAGWPTYTTSLANIIAVNTDTALITFTIPSYAQVGTYDLRIQTSSPYTGYHYLRSSFTIGAAQAHITGKVYYDANSNGIYDAGDAGISNKKVLVTPDNVLAFSNYAGDYSVGVANGTHTVDAISDSCLTQTSLPATYSVYVNNNTAVNKDFGFTSGATCYDLQPYTYGSFRCNVQRTYSSGFTNNNPWSGQLSGVFYFVHSPNMTFISAVPAPTSTNGDTLFWTFTNVLSATFNPTFLNPGGADTVYYSSHVQIISGGNVVYENSTSYMHDISCSYDPNDKSASPIGVTSWHYTLMNQPLLYHINFQNTGNDTAYQVTILDQLDSDLDWTTFQVIGSSHSVVTELNQTSGLLKFDFFNINLLDSVHNEPASHGFVQYRINPKPNLPDFTFINNTADIIFDLNVPVTTNTTLNTYVTQIPTGIFENTSKDNNGVQVFPNPFNNSAWVVFTNPEKKPYTFKIFSITGELVLSKTIADNKLQIEKANLANGMYIYTLYPTENRSDLKHGKIVIQ